MKYADPLRSQADLDRDRHLQRLQILSDAVAPYQNGRSRIRRGNSPPTRRNSSKPSGMKTGAVIIVAGHGLGGHALSLIQQPGRPIST